MALAPPVGGFGKLSPGGGERQVGFSVGLYPVHLQCWLKTSSLKLAMVLYTFKLRTQEAEREACGSLEFEASLVYVLSSRPASK